MNKNVTNVLTGILWVLMAASAVLFYLMVSNIGSPKEDSLIDLNIRWGYALFGFGIVAALGFSVYQIATSGKQALKTLGSLVVFGLLTFVAYSLASDEIPVFHNSDVMIEKGLLSAGIAKATDTLLYLTYILFGGAIFAIIYSSASRLWR